jgi:hypothetical protein
MAMMKSGLTIWQALGMTFIVFAGSAQLASLPLIAANVPVWVVFLTALVVNLRFVIFAAAVGPHFAHLPWYKRVWHGYFNADMTLHALYRRFRIREIPVEYRDRPEGSFSKLNTFSDGAKVLFTIAQILRYYRPLLFFTGLAVLFAALGGIASIPVFEDWFSARYIYHVPLAILASALEIVAVMMFGIGLILDSVSHQQRLEYERQLLAGEKTAMQLK